jgi:hypothetical protein
MFIDEYGETCIYFIVLKLGYTCLSHQMFTISFWGKSSKSSPLVFEGTVHYYYMLSPSCVMVQEGLLLLQITTHTLWSTFPHPSFASHSLWPPDNQPSTLDLHEINIFRLQIWVWPWGTCLSVPDLLHRISDFHIHPYYCTWQTFILFWLMIIPCCICTTFSLSITSWWTLTLFPPLDCYE